MMNVPADLLDKYAADMLKDKNTARNVADRAVEEKITATIKKTVTLNEKEISAEDFYKMIENK